MVRNETSISGITWKLNFFKKTWFYPPYKNVNIRVKFHKCVNNGRLQWSDSKVSANLCCAALGIWATCPVLVRSSLSFSCLLCTLRNSWFVKSQLCVLSRPGNCGLPKSSMCVFVWCSVSVHCVQPMEARGQIARDFCGSGLLPVHMSSLPPAYMEDLQFSSDTLSWR